VVAAFLKDAVCTKSSEVIEKKPVAESCVGAPLRKPSGTRKCAQAETKCGVCLSFGQKLGLLRRKGERFQFLAGLGCARGGQKRGRTVRMELDYTRQYVFTKSI